MRTVIITIGLLVAFTAPVTADYAEKTTGVCYQNDGAHDVGTGCDFPDTAAALLATPPAKNNCNTDLQHDGGKTWGTLYPLHEQAGVPEIDPADFCYAHIYPSLPSGSRVSVSLRLANQDAATFEISLHLWDPVTGEEIEVTIDEPTADAAASTAAEEGADVVSVHSGRFPFHPISISSVSMDGVPVSKVKKSFAKVGELDFVVKNEPAAMTVYGETTGERVDLKTTNAVRLCAFEGTLAVSEGNIKFDGQAVSWEVGADVAVLAPCQELPKLDPVCTKDGAGNVNACAINVAANIPTVIFEARAHPAKTGDQVSLVGVGQKKCHTLCHTLGVEDPFPSDWFIDLESLTGASS